MTQQTPVVINDRYELHKQIARGGMAEVFLARDLLLNRPVAVKILFPEFAADESFVERFRREAQSAANLTHPNIVAVYDWGAFEETYYIVMEYVEGRTLADLLRSEGTLHPNRASDVATDIAGALFFAHRNGVVHRDIKPGNVIMTPTGQLKVTDFGIARAMGSTASDNLTKSGAVMGTATYFSPEQAQGKAVDPRSDLYSLGVVLYEMLTGTPPFRGDTPVAIAYKHVKETPPTVRSVNPSVPHELESITQKLLAKNPTNRYPSAEDLRRDLRRYREGQPVTAEPLMAPPEAQAVADAPVADATRVGIGAGADATQAMNVAHNHQPTQMYGEVQPYEAPRRTGVFLGVLVIMLALLGFLLFLFAQELGIGQADEPSVVQVEVLDVVGQTEEIATATLRGAGFDVAVVYEENDLQPAGMVVQQDPAALAIRDRGDTVTLTVSSTEALLSVPSVIGMQEVDASRVLRDAGFEVRPRRQPDDVIPEDEVIDQVPPPGSEVPEGEEITLTVSLGSERVTIPVVAGKTIEQAFSDLSREGFFPSAEREKSAEQPLDLVVRTDPPAGTEADPDSVVVVFLSDGPPVLNLPNVKDQTADVAQANLAAANLAVTINYVELRAGDPRIGRVLSQNPRAGTQVEELATVILDIGKLEEGSNTTQKPDETTTTSPPTTEAPAPTTTVAPPPEENDGDDQ